MTNAAIGDFNLHILRSGRTAIDRHGDQGLVGTARATGFDGHRNSPVWKVSKLG
jgi:hypothetical protein